MTAVSLTYDEIREFRGKIKRSVFHPSWCGWCGFYNTEFDSLIKREFAKLEKYQGEHWNDDKYYLKMNEFADHFFKIMKKAYRSSFWERYVAGSSWEVGIYETLRYYTFDIMLEKWNITKEQDFI